MMVDVRVKKMRLTNPYIIWVTMLGLLILGSTNRVIANQPPVAYAEPEEQTVFVGGEAWFEGNLSYDPDGNIVSYYWDFGDGNFSNESNASHVYTVPGDYNVTLTVTDNKSATDTDIVNVTVLESPPVEVTVWIEALTTDKLLYNVTEAINATVKVRRGNDPLTSVWEGSLFFEVLNSTADLVYTEERQVILTSGGMTEINYFELNLTEADEYLLRATLYKSGEVLVDMKDISITVIGEPQNQQPVAIINPNYQTVNVSEEISFYGNSSYDPDGHIISYDWDFGDGTSGSGMNISHIYNSPGNYTVNLTVKDNSSATDTGEAIVKVIEFQPANESPIANAEPDTQTVNIGEETWFSGNESYDPDGYIVSYNWDFGDGNFSNGVNISHVYNLPGNYSVTLMVTDNDGATNEDIVMVIVDELRSEPTNGNETQPSIEDSGQWNITVTAAIAVGILSVFAIIYSTEVGKYLLLSLILPLYTKLRKEKILDHFIRGKIYGYIIANPGDNYNSIKRALNISDGSFAYHLHVLEKEGFIKSARDGTYKRFYPSGMQIPSNEGTLKNSQMLIIEKIKETPGISQKDIASLLGVSSPTINYHVKELLKLGIIKVERKGMRLMYYINTEKEEVEKVVKPKGGLKRVQKKKLIDAGE